MAIEDVLARISSIQARFGLTGFGTAEFQGLLSDAARHAGVSPQDRVDEAGAATVSLATGDSTAEVGTGSAGRATESGTDDAPSGSADGPDDLVPAADDFVVGVLEDLGVPAEVAAGGLVSGEAFESLTAAGDPAAAAASLLGGAGSTSVLDLIGAGPAGTGASAEETALLASVIAQQQAAAGIVRNGGS